MDELEELNNERKRENVEYKDCGIFNVALDFVLFKDDSTEWQVIINWTDDAYPTNKDFKTYKEAYEEYNRWGIF